MRFAITAQPIDAAGLKAGMTCAEAGALATFEGWVRNHNDGRAVALLEYEAFPELAQHEGEAILAEARRRFAIEEACCVHRVGRLAIGELAVWVGVTAKHRDAAFRACRMIIDAVKARVPIWKKEHHVDGAAAWVRCDACAAHAHGHAAEAELAGVSAEERQFYRCQINLNAVGAAGQAALKAARVVVVGAGGLGCPALQYLAAAGVGRIAIWDGDQVDASNLHRQVLYAYADVGRPKAEVAAEVLSALNPFITVTPHVARLSSEQASAAVGEADVVLDCTDNFATRFLLHDACQAARVPLVQGAIHQFEGQLQVFRPGVEAGCLRCLWPEPPEEGCVGTCAEVGVLGPVAGVLGGLQAMEALKLLLNLEGVCDRDTLLVDLLTHEVRRIRRERNPACACGAPQRVPATSAARATAEPDWLVDAYALSPERLASLRVIDIRSPEEREGDPDWVQCLPNIPWHDVEALARLSRDASYLLVCAAGVRSRVVAARLHQAGHTNYLSLRQGIHALADLLSDA